MILFFFFSSLVNNTEKLIIIHTFLLCGWHGSRINSNKCEYPLVPALRNLWLCKEDNYVKQQGWELGQGRQGLFLLLGVWVPFRPTEHPILLGLGPPGQCPGQEN